MRLFSIVVISALGIGFANSPSYAIGCISGGLAGAAAGHLVHHGVLGAVGGCIVGHEHHKHEMERQVQTQQYNPDQSSTNRSGY